MMTIRSETLRMTARALAVSSLCVAFTPSAHAFLEDAEARKAILELRQRFDASTQENAQLRRSLLDLQAQIEHVRSDLAQLRGQSEQLARETTEVQQRQSDLAKGLDERMSRFEPVQIQIDGLDFTADPSEKAAFEAALEKFRAGDFPAARTDFANFVNTYPSSGYIPSARFWLGNTQYAARDYKEAIANFRSLLRSQPQHARAAEASLSIANCQVELKDVRGARKTLEDLIKNYPETDTAQAAKERLQRLK